MATESGSGTSTTEVPQPVKLPDPPTDGITALSYMVGVGGGTTTTAQRLLVSTSWDGTIRIHDTGKTENDFADAKLVLTKTMVATNTTTGSADSSGGGGAGNAASGSPLLCLATSTGDNLTPSQRNLVYTGSLDGSIYAFDVETDTTTLIGKHSHTVGQGNDTAATANNNKTAYACSNIALFDESLVVTAGWDRRVHLWDIRQNNGANNATPAISVDLPGKAFCMDIDTQHARIAVGCSGRQTCLIDVRRSSISASDDQQQSASTTAEIALQGESSQKHQSRCLRFFPDGQRIAVGSVEGRVAVEWVDGRPLENNGTTMPKDYAFKCHRRNDLVFPVNCIEFHPIYGTFATGGGDGTVVTWDGFNRKRLTALPPFGTSVAALAFSPDGTTLAMASSYTFEEGERDHPRDEIYVRRMLDTDVQKRTTQ